MPKKGANLGVYSLPGLSKTVDIVSVRSSVLVRARRRGGREAAIRTRCRSAMVSLSSTQQKEAIAAQLAEK